jgi:hypothetical protein
VAEASLYQRPEKADERADMGGGKWEVGIFGYLSIPGGGTRANYRRERGFMEL